MDDASASAFARETWAMYGVGVVTVILRYTSRIRRFGIRNLKWDDYLMLHGFCWYTMLCIALNRIASGGGSNLITPEELAVLTQEQKEERIRGSKWVFVSEHCSLLALWSMKACMLILYASLTDGVKHRKYFNWLGVFVAAGFVGSELALFLICRPIQQYWALPPDNPVFFCKTPAQCYNYAYYEIVQACFSIPADFCMLVVAVPLIINLRVTIQQKLVLLLIFGMGGFVIVSAIMTKIYCLVPYLISYVYMNWYFREASVALYVTNIPPIWPLAKDVSRRLGISLSSHSSSYKYGPHSSQKQSIRHRSSNSHVRMVDMNLEMDSFSRSAKSSQLKGTGGCSESQEHITAGNINEYRSNNLDEPPAIQIKREVTFTVESLPADTLIERGEWVDGNTGHIVTSSRDTRDPVPPKRGATWRYT